LQITSTLLVICYIALTFMAQISSAYGKDAGEQFDCGRSFCGCWKDVEIQYRTIIVSQELIPQPNIKVSCPGKGILGISDESGKAAFTLKTAVSPGCGLLCGELLFEKESSTSYEAWEISIDSSDKQVILGSQYLKEGGRKNGENDGMWREWCRSRQWGVSGQLRVSGNYNKGLKNGEWIEWHCAGGNKKSQGKYEYDKKEGIWQEWYENGQYRSKGEWRNDGMSGYWIFWHPNGQKSREGEWRDNKPYGTQTHYDSMTGEKYFTDSNGHKITNSKVKLEVKKKLPVPPPILVPLPIGQER